VVIDTGATAAFITILRDCDWTETPFASVAFTVKVAVPGAVGVPVTVMLLPALEPRPIPTGKAPDANDHVNGGTPPVPVMLPVYAVPTVPAGRLAFEIVGGGAKWIIRDADLLGSAIEVAVIVAVVALLTLAGAL
jgi:hypothetical protein